MATHLDPEGLDRTTTENPLVVATIVLPIEDCYRCAVFKTEIVPELEAQFGDRVRFVSVSSGQRSRAGGSHYDEMIAAIDRASEVRAPYTQVIRDDEFFGDPLYPPKTKMVDLKAAIRARIEEALAAS